MVGFTTSNNPERDDDDHVVLARLAADLRQAFLALSDQVRQEGYRAIEAGRQPQGVIAWPGAGFVAYTWAGHLLLRRRMSE
jgi:hypothetical protein